MTNIDAVERRLVNQLLAGGSRGAPEEVVKILGAIQAQNYAGGEWSIGLRIPGSTIHDIDKAIEERKIVRTWAMRGTLHFLAASDIDWVLWLLAPGLIAGLGRRYKELGLDDTTFGKAERLFGRILKGANQLTRKELVTILEKNGISCEGQRAAFILHRASIDRVICFGVNRGKQETHALFEEWVSPAKSMTRENALAELARRYFTCHGPATIQDYVWWSGLRAPDANAGLDAVKPELAQVLIEGKTYWMPRRTSHSKPKAPIVRLLPMFDGFLLAYKDRSASLEPAVFRKLRTGGMPDPAIMIDGKIAGKWSRQFVGDSVVVTTKCFRKIGGDESKALEETVKKYSAFMRKNLKLAGQSS